MTVVRLVQRSNKETVETVEWMLQEAKEGRLNDLIALFPGHRGAEVAAVTGRYRSDSSKALMAIMRMSNALTKAHDTVYGPPPR